MNDELEKLIRQISRNATKGRLLFEAEDPLADDGGEDPLAGGDEGGEEDPLGGGDEDPLGGDDMGGDLGGEESEEDPADAAETEKAEAEADKAQAEAEAAKAEADAAKAEADQEKSEAEREKAEAERNNFSGTKLFSRPGVSVILGILMDKFSESNELSSLAQELVTKLRLDKKGMQKFKSDAGPLLKLQGFNQLVNDMQNHLTSSGDDEVDDAANES
jgi:F0F1-type ATP synthase assembly protein I